MRILIVHAHPEPRSFSAALAGEAVAVLGAAGHDVVLSDLYAMRFDPVAKAADFATRRDPDYLRYAIEQRHAVETGTLAPDIAAEVAKVQAAELLILNFPIFWFAVPAIMKGWIDRVLLSGPFYGGRRFYDRGGLAGRRAMLSATLGARAHMLGPRSVHGELETMLRPLVRGTLHYVGYGVLSPFVAWHVPYLDDATRRATLEALREHLRRLETLPVEPPPALDRFDEVMRPLA